MRLCPWHTWPFDPGGRVAGEQFAPRRRLKFAMALMGKPETKVSELCKELFGVKGFGGEPLKWLTGKPDAVIPSLGTA